MYDALKAVLLPVLKLPTTPPDPPTGHAPGEFLKTLQAAPNYLHYRIFQWVLGVSVLVVVELIGIVAALIAFPLGGLILAVRGHPWIAFCWRRSNEFEDSPTFSENGRGAHSGADDEICSRGRAELAAGDRTAAGGFGPDQQSSPSLPFHASTPRFSFFDTPHEDAERDEADYVGDSPYDFDEAVRHAQASRHQARTHRMGVGPPGRESPTRGGWPG